MNEANTVTGVRIGVLRQRNGRSARHIRCRLQKARVTSPRSLTPERSQRAGTIICANQYLRLAQVSCDSLLHPVHIDCGLALQQKLRDRNKLITLGLQRLDDARERLWCVLGGIVKQHDAAGLHPREHALRDFVGGNALPVEGISFPNSLKPLKINEFFGF